MKTGKETRAPKGMAEAELQAFEQQMRENERAEATIQKYMRELHQFAAYLGTRRLDKEAVLGYRNELLEKNKPRTVNGKLSAVNAYLRFLGLERCRVRLLRLQSVHFAEENRMLQQAEYQRLIAAAEQLKNERMSLLMQTIGSTGIRISELRYITLEAVKKREACISMKGKHRRVVLTKELCRKLYAYAAKRKIRGSIFVSRSGRPLNRSNIWREMKSLCGTAHVNPEKVYPHSFRHLFARKFYAVRHDLGYLADLLGHSSVNTTRIYTAQSVQVHRRILEGLHLVL